MTDEAYATREATLLERVGRLEDERDKLRAEIDVLKSRLSRERDRLDRVLGSEPEPDYESPKLLRAR